MFPVKPWEASLSPHRPFHSYTAVGFMKELLFFLIEIASLANPSTFPPVRTPSIILKGEFLGVPSASNCEERLEMQKDEAPKTDRDRSPGGRDGPLPRLRIGATRAGLQQAGAHGGPALPPPLGLPALSLQTPVLH